MKIFPIELLLVNPRNQHSLTIENSGSIKWQKQKQKHIYLYVCVCACVNIYVNVYVLCDYVGQLRKS